MGVFKNLQGVRAGVAVEGVVYMSKWVGRNSLHAAHALGLFYYRYLRVIEFLYIKYVPIHITHHNVDINLC